MRGFKNESGYTLAEVIIACAIFAILSVFTSTLMVQVANFSASMTRETNRTGIIQTVVSAVRSPTALQASLLNVSGQTLDCLQYPGHTCPASGASTPFSLVTNSGMALAAQTDYKAALTTAGASVGYGYYADDGTACDSANYSNGQTCPIRVTTNYDLLCPGGTASGFGNNTSERSACALGQAGIGVNYIIEPNTYGEVQPRANQYFQPVTGTEILKGSDLYSNALVTSSAVANRDIINNDRAVASLSVATSNVQVTKTCLPGSVMVGVSGTGNVVCDPIDTTTFCGNRGDVFLGFKMVGTTITAVCSSSGCSQGKTLQGYDVSGAPICAPVNSSGTMCSPMSGTAVNPATNQFMTGLDSSANPICHRVTCPAGKISACWTGPDVQCVDTTFIPVCPAGGNCNYSASVTPDTQFATQANVAGVVPFEGYPFVRTWQNGEPLQGYRKSYRNWGAADTGSTPTLTGLFGDYLNGGSLTNMARYQADPTDQGNTNLKVTHTYMYLSKISSPPDLDSSLKVRTWTRKTETCAITNNYTSGTATISCPSGAPATDSKCYTDTDTTAPTAVGYEACNSYSNWVDYVSINYYYNKSSTQIVCGGSIPNNGTTYP